MKMETLRELRKLNLGQNGTNSKKGLAKKEEKKVSDGLLRACLISLQMNKKRL